MIAAFGACEIDLDRVEIRRDGVVVPVQPQVFDVVQYLVEHRDRVVTKEELLDNVWGDRFVSESALTSRIKSARRALGDDGVTQRVIKTVHGRGYRFVAEPATAARAAADSQHGTRPTVTTDTARRWPIVGRDVVVHDIVSGTARGRGVVVSGPGGIGRTTLVAAVADECESQGRPVRRVRGTAGSSDIPLSCLAHLLPSSVFVVDTAGGRLPDDLARSAVWQEARRAIAEIASEPIVISIDDAEHLDDHSRSLLVSLASTGEIVPVVAVRAGYSDDSFLALSSTDQIDHVVLDVLDEADVDALLFRRLGGPVELASIEHLTHITGGVPGMLVDIVDASIDAGVLRRDEGVWRLVGPAVSSRSLRWPDPDLPPEVVDAAGRLALLGTVPLDLALGVVDETVLGELDRARLVAVGGVGEAVTLGITDPLLASAVVDGISPLRRRTMVAELTRSLEGVTKPPDLLARMLDWDAAELSVSADELVGGAIGALLDGDLSTAERLVASLDHDAHPEADVLEAEVAAGLGQFDRAKRALARVDLDALDELSTRFAIRRRATLDFVYAGRHEHAVAEMRRATSQYGDVAGPALSARLLGLLNATHQYAEVISLAADLGDLDGHAGLEVDMAVAWARAGRGELEESISLAEQVLSRIDDVPPYFAGEIRDMALVTRLSALQQIGRLDDASKLARTHAPVGRISRLGFFPAVAADIELEAGRPRSAREMLRSATSAWVRTVLPQFTTVVTSMSARCELALGNLDAARALAVETIEGLESGTGAARSRTVAWLIEMLDPLGLPPLDVTDVLETSVEGSAVLSEMEIRCALVRASGDAAVAREHLPRIEAVAGSFDGVLWPIRVDEIRARAAGRPLDDCVERYRDLGYLRLAGWVERSA